MGFVSAIVINNDLLDAIAKDPEFGFKVHNAVLSLSFRMPERSIQCGPGSAATAIACHHASTGVPVIIGGGNFHTVIKDIHLSEHGDPELALLSQLALKHGYNLTKRRIPK